MNIWLKIRPVLLILILVGGVAFLVFAVFLNRAELSITAEVPFNLSIYGQQSRYCETSPCLIALAPGKYYLTIDKSEYQQVTDEVELKLGQKMEKSYQLIRTPKLTGLADGADEAVTFLEDPLPKLISGLPDNIAYFKAPASNNVYFLADNPQTYLPSLYLKDTDQADQPPRLLVNFLRGMEKVLIRINPEETMVSIIDQSDPQNASLYLVDLQAKSRLLAAQNALIADALWLPRAASGQQYLLLEKINRDSLQPEVSLLDAANPSVEVPLPVSTRLFAVQALGPQEILYAEPYENQSADGTGFGFTVKMLNLQTQLSQDIFTIPGMNLPQKMEFGGKTKILLMLIDGKVYSLSPIL